MQRRSIYKQKAGALFMDTRPVYFGKIFFQKPKSEKAWAARSYEMRLRNGKTAINDKKRF